MPSLLVAALFLLAAGVQYGLAAHVIGDLWRRDRVNRHGRVTWALLVLCLPYVGPVLYVVYAIEGPPPGRPIWEQSSGARRLRDMLQLGGRGAIAAPPDPANWGDELVWQEEFVIDPPLHGDERY